MPIYMMIYTTDECRWPFFTFGTQLGRKKDHDARTLSPFLSWSILHIEDRFHDFEMMITTKIAFEIGYLTHLSRKSDHRNDDLRFLKSIIGRERQIEVHPSINSSFLWRVPGLWSGIRLSSGSLELSLSIRSNNKRRIQNKNYISEFIFPPLSPRLGLSATLFWAPQDHTPLSHVPAILLVFRPLNWLTFT